MGRLVLVALITLLVLPTPAGVVPVEEDYLQRLIRRALGYHVRIRE